MLRPQSLCRKNILNSITMTRNWTLGHTELFWPIDIDYLILSNHVDVWKA